MRRSQHPIGPSEPLALSGLCHLSQPPALQQQNLTGPPILSPAVAALHCASRPIPLRHIQHTLLGSFSTFFYLLGDSFEAAIKFISCNPAFYQELLLLHPSFDFFWRCPFTSWRPGTEK